MKENLFILSLKSMELFSTVSFCKNNFVFEFQDLSEEKILVSYGNKKIIVSLNEVFDVHNEMYVFILNNKPISLLYKKNDDNGLFCLLSTNYIPVKKIILNINFFTQVFKNFFILLYLNYKKMIVLIICSLFPYVFMSNKIANENIFIENEKIINAKKIFFGYKNAIKNIKIEEKIINTNLDNNKFNYNHIKEKLSYKNLIKKNIIHKKINIKFKESIDSDLDYFLKMNNNKRKKYD